MQHAVFPVQAQLALLNASHAEPELRIGAIDRVTDQMAEAGLVRPRNHDSGWTPFTMKEASNG